MSTCSPESNKSLEPIIQLALFGAKQAGVKDREGKYRGDHHKGDESDGRL